MPVVCLNGEEMVDAGEGADDTNYNGLAMATTCIENLPYSVGETKCMNAMAGDHFNSIKDVYDGIYQTHTQAAGCGDGHDHPAAKLCQEYQPVLAGEARERYNFSQWFLPSYGQWVLVCKAFGIWVDEYSTREKMAAQLPKVAQIFKSKGWSWDGVFDRDMWTATQHSNGKSDALLGGFLVHNDGNDHTIPTPMTETHPAVPFMAFKYN